MQKDIGVLLAVFSLPGQLGIGDFGASAYDFIDTIKKSEINIWQILPLHPTGYGNSPYQSFSAYAGDFIYIDIESLYADLNIKYDVAPIICSRVDYVKVRAKKLKLLKEGFKVFDITNQEFNSFIESTFWLKPYATYMSKRTINQNLSWPHWTNMQVDENEVYFHYFVQYYFYKQWNKLKTYANSLNIKIMGDIPFYVSFDSADVYNHPKNFLLDDNNFPLKVAGVPPDYFNENGQLWGNPIYDWSYLEHNQFKFYIDRLLWEMRQFDILRIDHFRAFDTYWQVDYKNEIAKDGQWIVGPGEKFFNQLNKQVEDLNLVAEDLGEIRPETIDLRKKFNLPGMRILQFELNHQGLNDLEHIQSNTYIYTGTHDNQTLRSFIQDLSRKERHAIEKLLKARHISKLNVYSLVEYVLSLKVQTVIFPLQDLLNYNDLCRINTPGTLGSPNWEWKLMTLKQVDLSKFVNLLNKKK